MEVHGHVENGVIVPDVPLPLEEGARVRIQILAQAAPSEALMPLQGTPYTYIDPDEPALSEEEWGGLS